MSRLQPNYTSGGIKMIYDIRLHILSPVHIGCDESYTPIQFVIDSDKCQLIEFDLWDFINSLKNRDLEELTKISEKASPTVLVELYKFYHARKNKIKGRIIPVPKQLSERYESVRQMSNNEQILKEFNRFEIPKTFFNPYTKAPLIPGSSVKGSLRTGYVEGLLKQQGNLELYKNKSYDKIEAELLGGTMQFDPLRLLKISDFEPEREVKTKIIYQVNIKKEGEGFGRALSLPIEVIPEGYTFRGTVKIDQRIPNSGIKRAIDLKEFLSFNHSHYEKILNMEFNIAKKKKFWLPPIDKFREKIKEKFFLIRVGKHSGAEAVTWEGLRKIKVRTSRGTQKMSSATTIWLASEERKPATLKEAKPFGWIMLEVLNEYTL